MNDNRQTNGQSISPNKDPGFPDEIWPRAANQGKVYILARPNRYVESERGQGVFTSKNKEDHRCYGVSRSVTMTSAGFVPWPRSSLPKPPIVVELGATT